MSRVLRYDFELVTYDLLTQERISYPWSYLPVVVYELMERLFHPYLFSKVSYRDAYFTVELVLPSTAVIPDFRQKTITIDQVIIQPILLASTEESFRR